MKKFIVFSVIIFLSGIVFIACQRDRGVYAGNESGTYQPRPAPVRNTADKQEMKGELVRVDPGGKSLSIRIENGLVQTFNVDDSTVVTGLENEPQKAPAKPSKASANSVRNLIGKEGSELTVQWDNQDNAKMATNIDVTQISTSKNTRRAKRR